MITGSKYIWRLPEVNTELLHKHALAYNISFPVMQALLSRGYVEKEMLDSYLFSTFERDVTHASQLKDAEKAVDRILYALKNKEKILICGDYDVDGITSSALLLLCLLPLDAQVNFFLPHRVKDGYGLSVKTVQKAAQSGYSVLITVDNGITAFEPAREAKKLGIDLIVTDHHKPHEQLPEAFAIINPHQKDCLYPYKLFAGVGVSFKIMSLLYERLGRELPAKVYELLLLGTVADVVPLTGENRFWVRHGLQHVNTHESFSLQVLKKNARVTKPQLSSLDIGFFITPQINALGRLEDARSGVKFLIGSNQQETEQVGGILRELNEARRSIEKQIFDEIQERIDRKDIDLDTERIILTGSDRWQPGVIGLVASRLVAAHNRPVLLYHVSNAGLAKGSCRSIAGFNMFEALQSQKELLTSFGGHAMAAGFALPLDKLPEFKRNLEHLISTQIPVFEPKPTLTIDAELLLSDTNKKLISDMAYLEPFGNENTQPVFYIKQATLLDAPQVLKDVHVKCKIFSEGIIKPVMFFNRPELIPLLQARQNEQFDLAVYATENHWNGKVSIELQGVDIAL
jgi:single-stranded-DNA-specific exonuclease